MDQSQQNQKRVNGLLLEQTVDFLRMKKGNEEVIDFEKSFGSVIFDHYQMYPIETLLKLQEEVVRRVFGTIAEQSYRELGRYTFDAFSHTLVGATLTNVSTAPIVILQKIQDIWQSVVNFGTRKLVESDEKNGKAVIEITDDPRNPDYIRGIIEGGLLSVKATNPKTTISNKNANSYQIEITWIPSQSQ